MTHPLNAAFEYASKGWPVGPLNGKIPATKHGFKDFTTDRDQLKAWFEGPNAYTNIGVAIPDGYWVLDVDPRNGGNETLTEIKESLPTTKTALTGGGGWHLWFKGDAPRVRLPGIDIKAGGKGYVVMPPSIHPETQNPYQWAHWTEKEPIAEFSGPLHFPGSQDTGELLWDVLDASQYAREAAESSDPILSGGADGQHNTLLAVAGHALALYPVPVARLVYDNAVARCVPAHPEAEVERIWQWTLEKQATGDGLVEVEETVADEGVPVDGSIPPGGQEELKRITAREWALRQRQEKEAEKLPLPMFKSAWQLLEEPEPPLNWRIEEILPAESVAVLHAGAKVGKTHIIGHMVHSLLSGNPFLERYATTATTRNVVLVDLELSERILRSWSEKFDNKSERLKIASLRGNSRAMDVMSDAHFDRVVRAIQDQNPGVLIIDPLGPMLGARGIEENDNGAVRGLLDRLMDLKISAAVDEMIVSHHAGHSSRNRTRGASVFLDWPDVLIGARRKNEEDPAAPRLLSAYGRDVHLPETELCYDPLTGSLTVAEVQSVEEALLRVITDNPGLQADEICSRLGSGRSERSTRRDLDALVLAGRVRTEELPGRGRPRVYFIEDPLS